MLKVLFFTLILTASAAWASPGPGECSVEGKPWDVLVQEFIGGWQGRIGDLCEFKRFIALSTMISSDMRLDEVQYENRISQLEGFDDQVEAVNYLLVAFQETWFSLFVDAALEREYQSAKQHWYYLGGGAGTVAVAAAAAPMTRKLSPKTMRFLRQFATNYFGKRAVVLGATASGKGASRLSFGPKPESKVEFVRPPLMSRNAGSLDVRTNGVFVNEFWNSVEGGLAGAVGGYVGGHAISLAVKKVAPKWNTWIQHELAQHKVANFASPGVVVGTIATIYLTDKIDKMVNRAKFFENVGRAKNGLLALARETGAAVAVRDEYKVWVSSEQLKNALMLQNYLLTREFRQLVADESERAIGETLENFTHCWSGRAQTLAAQRARFSKRIRDLVAEQKLNLESALDITQAVQEELLKRADPMVDPLIDSGLNFLERDKYLLDADAIIADNWEDIAAAVNDSRAECTLSNAGAYP